MRPAMTTQTDSTRWSARPLQAVLLRGVAMLTPLAASIAFVHLASRAVPAPAGAFWLFASWWVLMTAAATVVLLVIERVSRRLLPLAALFKLSLVFPDRAPSRFRVALRTGDVTTLGERIARAKRGAHEETPVEAAQRLLELVAALDVHDRLTRGHSERVRAYAQMIGQELGLSKRDLDLLNWAALLHDIGKLEVASEILTKSGRPTDDEWAQLKRHPEVGDELVAPLRAWLGEWATAVRDHHERWDGAGYPAGKTGEEIAVAGRIVAVADVFDVITSARSYKRAAGAVEGRSEIARCAGSQFDPRVVRAFLGVSLGRLRFAMGPLAWLAQAPALGRLPLTPALGSATGSLAVVATAFGAGLVAEAPAGPASPARVAISSPAPAQTTLPRVRSARGVSARPSTPRAARPPAPVEAAPPAPVEPAPPAPAAQAARLAAPSVEVEIDEDQVARVRLDGVTGSDAISSLDVRTPPSTGRASATEDLELLYAPPPDYHGTTAFGYEACWGARGCATGRVVVTVRPVNDSPTAGADEASTRAGAPVEIAVLANDSDVDGDPLTVLAVDAPWSAGGAVTNGRTVTYRPARRFTGRAVLAYSVADPHGGRATGSMVVTVSGGNTAPAARDDSATVLENGTVTVDVLANDADPDRDELTIAIVGSPSEGAAELVGGKVRYTAPVGFNGSASFTYEVADGAGATAAGTVSVTVLPVNSPPSFSVGPHQTVAEDSAPQSVPGFVTAISPGPPDEVSQSVSFSVSSTKPSLFAAGGQPVVTPGGALTFALAPDRTGTATVTVRAVDDGGTLNGGVDTSDPQSFTITVTPVNDPPVAADDTVTLDEDDPDGVTFSVVANDVDVDGDAISLASYDSAITSGTLTDLGGGSFGYVPDAGVSGTQTFTYTVSDGKGGTDTATVTIVVTPQPDAPQAAADAYVTPQDTPLARPAPGVLANDADQDGDSLTVDTTPVSPPVSGTLSLAASGGFTYVPNAGFVGTDTFSYRVQDGTGATDTATVTITVSAAISTSTFYLQPSGASADVWNLSTALPPAAVLVPDHDGDLAPGLTIKASDGDESNSDPLEWQDWVRSVPAPLVLNGPVTLQLWSSIALFESNRSGHPYVYLYDCAAGGTSCVRIAATDVQVNQWNGLLSTWVFKEITVGSVARTIPAGRELRVRLLFKQADLWLAMTAGYPSALVVTLGP